MLTYLEETRSGLDQAVQRLLDEGGFSDQAYTLEPVDGGGNNRVYRVVLACGQALLKAYFRHPLDPRDRLRAEFDFTCFAWDRGLRQTAQPLACDAERGLGLYEFIEGRKLTANEIDDRAVSQALAFCRELNRHRRRPEARRLPAGSEACFSLADHCRCVERRLTRCDAWQPNSAVEREARAFVVDEVLPCWRHIRAQAETEAARIGLGLAEILPEPMRCLSPSDFGFHNALLESSGRLRFIDFEYAGWDDPAKLACDFFCQPALPVPDAFWDGFVRELACESPDPDRERRRMNLLLPVYRVKWVTILLNDFHPAGNDRRRFARPGQDAEKRKIQQLARARFLLSRL